MVVIKTTFITNEVWYSIKYNLKCIGNVIEISMHFDGFETAKELLIVMTLILLFFLIIKYFNYIFFFFLFCYQASKWLTYSALGVAIMLYQAQEHILTKIELPILLIMLSPSSSSSPSPSPLSHLHFYFYYNYFII